MKRSAAELSNESGAPPGGGAAAAVAHEQAMAALGLGLPPPLVLAKMYRDESIRDIVRLCAVNRQLNATVCGAGARHREFWRLWGDEQRAKDGMAQAKTDFVRDAKDGQARLLEYAYLAGVDTRDILIAALEQVHKQYSAGIRNIQVTELLLEDPNLSEIAEAKTLLSTIVKSGIDANDSQLVALVVRNPSFELTHDVVNRAVYFLYPLGVFVRHPQFARIYADEGLYRQIVSLAIQNSHNDVRELIDYGTAPLRIVDENPNTDYAAGSLASGPLAVAIQFREFDLFKYMLDSGRAGDPQEILDLVAQVPTFESSTMNDMNSVYEIVQLLLQRGADVNGSTRRDRRTPLHTAARYGNVAATYALIKAGADVNALDRRGRTPIDYIGPNYLAEYQAVRRMLRRENA